MTDRELKIQCWHIAYAHTNALLASNKNVVFAIEDKNVSPNEYARQIADNIERDVRARGDV